MAAMLTKAVVHQLIILLIPLFLALRLNDFYPLLGKLLVGLRVYMPPTLSELAQFSASAREAMSRKGWVTFMRASSLAPLLCMSRSLLLVYFAAIMVGLVG